MKITKVKNTKNVKLDTIINHILERIANLESLAKDIVTHTQDMDNELDVITEAVFSGSATDRNHDS